MPDTKTKRPHHRRHIVRNKSSRNGRAIRAIAVHSTESQDLRGTRDDVISIRNWFNNPRSQASSHIGIDGEGHTELWVPEEEKAWTILDLNSVTLNIEFIGRAAQPAREWEDAQIRRGAQWAAYWSTRFNLPVQRGNVRNINGVAVVTKSGIIRHKDLTDAGFGSHTDPGPQFPMRRFIDLTRFYKRRGWPADN